MYLSALRLAAASALTPLLLAVAATAAAAPPIPNHPDEYDVPKYQHLAEQAAARLRQGLQNLAAAQARVDQLSSQSQQLQQQLSDLRGRIERARQDMANAQARIDQLKQANDQAQNELQGIQSQIPGAEQSANQARQERDRAQAAVASAQENYNRLDTSAKELERAASAARRDAQAKQQAVNSLETQLGQAQGRLQAAQSQKDEAAARIEQLQTQIGRLEQTLERARADIPALEREAEQTAQKARQAEDHAQKAEERAREAAANGDPNAPALARRAAEFRQRAADAALEARGAADRLERAKAAIPRHESALADARRDLDAARSKLSQLEGQIQQLQGQVGQLENQLASARQQASQADSTADAQEARARDARATAEQAKGAIAQAQQALNTAAAALERTTAEVSRLRNRAQALQTQINQNNAESQRQSQALANAVQQTQQLSRQFGDVQNTLRTVDQSLGQAVRERDAIAPQIPHLQAQNDAAQARLRQVQENLRRGIEIATHEGREDGIEDGAREGARLGAENGSRDGGETGAREGREVGTRDGIARAQSAGQQAGADVGSREGADQGQAQGQTNGLSEGRSRGRTEGLLAGYEAGRREGDATGYREGRTPGHAAGGYERGKTDGIAQGTARATREATQKGNADGYAKAEEEFYEKELADVTLPNSAGPQSAPFNHPRWGGYNPRRPYPHPAIREAYDRAYREAYQHSAGETYDRVYRETYRRAYDASYAVTYRDFASRDYPDHYRAAYDASYRASYDAAYRRAYDAAYQAAYTPAYQEAYRAAYPTRVEEGRRVGRAEGFERGKAEAYAEDYNRGKADGDKQGYDQTYPRVYEQAHRAGYAQGVNYFSTNAVLRLDGGVLVDSHDDSVFSPGERLSITLAVQNYGKVSQKDAVRVEIIRASEGLEVVDAADDLVKLPGQTRAVVTGVTQLRISPTIEPGTRLSAVARVSHGNTLLGELNLQITTGLPYTLPGMSLPEFVLPAQENEVSVEVRNVSTRASASDVSVKLISLDGLAQVTQGTSLLGRLNPAETKAARLSFTFPESAAFRTMAFEVQVVENGVILGKRRATVDSSKRWTFNPGSAGLLVVAQTELAKRAEEAARVAGLGMDLWDVRIDGQLTREVALKYLDKTLVLPTVEGGLGSATAEAVRELLLKDGSVYAGLSTQSERTAVGAVIAEVARRLPHHASFAGVNTAQGNFFAKAGEKALIVTGPDARATSSADLAGRLIRLDLLARDIQAKVAAYGQALAGRDSARLTLARDALLRDLIKEMQDDKAIDGNNYKKNAGALLLTAFSNIVLSKPQGEERKGLLSMHPALDKARKDLGWLLNGRRIAVKKVMKPLRTAYKKEID